MKFTRPLFSFFVLLSAFHIIRDIMQSYQIHNVATEIFHMSKNWCGPYCNTITFPIETFILVGSLIVLKRNRSGTLGKLIVFVFFLWFAMFLYDYLIFN